MLLSLELFAFEAGRLESVEFYKKNLGRMEGGKYLMFEVLRNRCWLRLLG